jgi:hypothetical protein
MAETDDKGYTVKDRRYLHMSEEEKAKIREEESSQKVEPETQQAAGEPPEEDLPLAEIAFSTFLLSLSTSAFTHLGAIPDPATGETKKNLLLAKQTIDLLGMLREKTRNNLSSDEEEFFDSLLYDLRMKYVKEVS